MSCWPSETSPPSILPPEMIEIPFQTQPYKRQAVSQHIRQQNADDERVGQELDKSLVVKRRRLRSKVWEDFEKYEGENGKDRARCKVCEKEFDGSSKSGTTHLRNHSTICKKKRNGDGGGVQPANLAGDLSNPIDIQEKSVMDKQLDPWDAARMIIKQGDASRINSTNKGYIINVYEEEKKMLHNYFEKLSCRLCLTVEDQRWYGTFLVVRFIDDDWKLKTKIIGFKRREFSDFTVKYIKNVLWEWGIENNLSSMVIDSDDDDLYRMINDEIREDRLGTQGSLLFNNKLLCTQTFFLCSDECKILSRNVIHDLLYERLLKLIKQIISASSKNERLHNAMWVAIKSLGKEMTVQDLIPKYVFGITSDVLGVLKIVLGLQETCFELENSHPHFQHLTKEEWHVLRTVYECFEDNGDFIRQYCNYNTANTLFPLLCRTYKCSKELRTCNINYKYVDFIERADSYWCKYNLVLAVASVLDPRFRMDIVKNWYKKIFGDEWETEFSKFMVYFTDRYNEYVRGNHKCTSGLEENNVSFSSEMLDPLGKSCNSSHELDHDQWQNPELRRYFEEVRYPKIKTFDILEWWRGQAWCFPTLARMARDFLSIQISCHPVIHTEESASAENEMDCAADSAIVEAYMCTKSWLRDEL